MTTGPTRKIEMTKILIEIDPETHVLVPREPSDEMLRKAIKVDLGKDCDEKVICISLYQAMLAAAPQPEPVESEPVCKWVKADGANYIRQEWHKDYVAVEGDKLYTTPQPDRTAELEAALKVARDGIDKFLVANDPTEFGCECDPSVDYLCGPCRADKQRQPLKSALAKINEVLK